MNCDDFQRRISEQLDAGARTALDATTEQHLAECATCRAFREAWVVLDEQLTDHAAKAVLPTDFKATLIAKLPAQSLPRSPAEVAALRAQLAQEQRETLAALQRQYLCVDVATLLRICRLIGGFVIAVALLSALARSLPEAVGIAFNTPESVKSALAFSLSLGIGAMLYGLNRLWHPFRRWLPGW